MPQVESKVSEQQWESHSQRMRREFAACGIRPFEVVPPTEEEGAERESLVGEDGSPLLVRSLGREW